MLLHDLLDLSDLSKELLELMADCLKSKVVKKRRLCKNNIQTFHMVHMP